MLAQFFAHRVTNQTDRLGPDTRPKTIQFSVSLYCQWRNILRFNVPKHDNSAGKFTRNPSENRSGASLLRNAVMLASPCQCPRFKIVVGAMIFIGASIIIDSASLLAEEIDETYATIVSALASPAYLDVTQLATSHSDTAVMIRMEIARSKLKLMRAAEPKITGARDKILPGLEACNRSMENLRQLDRYMPDIGGIVGKAIDTAPAVYKTAVEQDLNKSDNDAIADLIAKVGVEAVNLVVNAYQSSVERSNYINSYRTVRSSVFGVIVPLSDSRYERVPWTSEDLVKVDFDGSWNNTFIRDTLCLRNDSGKDLTNCTIFVKLKGRHAQSGEVEQDSHVHFISHWAKGKWLYAPYPSRGASGIASNESVDCVETITVWLLSDQFCKQLDYTYSGDEYDQDLEVYIKDYLDPSAFKGSWFNYENFTFFNRGLQLIYDGKLSRFPVSHINVEVTDGVFKQALRWSINDEKMQSGSFGKQWLSDARFNRYNPDKVTITLEFPYSEITKTIEWNFRK